MCYTNVVFNQNVGRVANRDEIQHQRINDRVGFQSRFQTAGNLIFKPQKQSSMFTEQRQRFNKDHAINDQIRRQQVRDKEDRFFEARLNKRLQMEERKWRNQEVRENKQQNKRIIHQKIQLDNNKNSNRLGYNPITHAYEPNERGQKLQVFDEKKAVNRFVRSKNIIDKTNQGFNIITGQDKTPHFQSIPQKIRNQVQTKYQAKKQKQAVKYEPIRDKYDYLDD